MVKVSEPRRVRYTAEKIAELKGMPLEKVEAVTSLNAERWLRLPL